LEDRKRLHIKPGITCIWQVSGRSDIPFNRQVELDKQYISSQSFWKDLLILLKTIPAVITGKGAY
jgi:lipopolysaccharide/colanic/teichoic acid biosynthesis glycosyltransferase